MSNQEKGPRLGKGGGTLSREVGSPFSLTGPVSHVINDDLGCSVVVTSDRRLAIGLSVVVVVVVVVVDGVWKALFSNKLSKELSDGELNSSFFVFIFSTKLPVFGLD